LNKLAKSAESDSSPVPFDDHAAASEQKAARKLRRNKEVAGKKEHMAKARKAHAKTLRRKRLSKADTEKQSANPLITKYAAKIDAASAALAKVEQEVDQTMKQMNGDSKPAEASAVEHTSKSQELMESNSDAEQSDPVQTSEPVQDTEPVMDRDWNAFETKMDKIVDGNLGETYRGQAHAEWRAHKAQLAERKKTAAKQRSNMQGSHKLKHVAGAEAWLSSRTKTKAVSKRLKHRHTARKHLVRRKHAKTHSRKHVRTRARSTAEHAAVRERHARHEKLRKFVKESHEAKARKMLGESRSTPGQSLLAEAMQRADDIKTTAMPGWIEGDKFLQGDA